MITAGMAEKRAFATDTVRMYSTRFFRLSACDK